MLKAGAARDGIINEGKVLGGSSGVSVQMG